MRKFRWFFLICAILMLIQTPFALSEAFSAMRTDARLIPAMAIAFLFRLSLIGGFLFAWWKLRPNQVLPIVTLNPKEALAGSFNVDRAYYLLKENTWSRLKLLAYDDVGRLAVGNAKIVFQSVNRTIVIDQIRRVSFGKQGRDFINDWVKVEYLDGSELRTAFFADGGSLGWSGVQGGTAELFKAIQGLPTVA